MNYRITLTFNYPSGTENSDTALDEFLEEFTDWPGELLDSDIDEW